MLDSEHRTYKYDSPITESSKQGKNAEQRLMLNNKIYGLQITRLMFYTDAISDRIWVLKLFFSLE